MRRTDSNTSKRTTTPNVGGGRMRERCERGGRREGSLKGLGEEASREVQDRTCRVGGSPPCHWIRLTFCLLASGSNREAGNMLGSKLGFQILAGRTHQYNA